MLELDQAIAQAEARPAVYVLANKQMGYLYKGASRNLKERLNPTFAESRASFVAHRYQILIAKAA